jgi:hypothetical protein
MKMTRTEVFELIEHIEAIYPGRFEVNEEKTNAFHFHLADQDKETVMKKLREHAKDNKFPPTISDLVERRKMDYELDDPLGKINKWEEEASGGPKR